MYTFNYTFYVGTDFRTITATSATLAYDKLRAEVGASVARYAQVTSVKKAAA